MSRAIPLRSGQACGTCCATSANVLQDNADELLDGWAAEAAARGLAPDDPRFWSEGWAWLVERVSRY
jgi:hypothetical protein